MDVVVRVVPTVVVAPFDGEAPADGDDVVTHPPRPSGTDRQARSFHRNEPVSHAYLIRAQHGMREAGWRRGRSVLREAGEVVACGSTRHVNVIGSRAGGLSRLSRRLRAPGSFGSPDTALRTTHWHGGGGDAVHLPTVGRSLSTASIARLSCAVEGCRGRLLSRGGWRAGR